MDHLRKRMITKAVQRVKLDRTTVGGKGFLHRAPAVPSTCRSSFPFLQRRSKPIFSASTGRRRLPEAKRDSQDQKDGGRVYTE